MSALNWIDINEAKPPVTEKVLVCGGDLEVAASAAMYVPAYGDDCFECDCFSDEMGREPELRTISFWAFYPEPKRDDVNTLPESTGTPCIREMCCNQFGERDEMQSIINSLQADVIARGARIEQLESEVINLESEVNDLCGYDKYNA